jgi:hypothetical protein
VSEFSLFTEPAIDDTEAEQRRRESYAAPLSDDPLLPDARARRLEASGPATIEAAQRGMIATLEAEAESRDEYIARLRGILIRALDGLERFDNEARRPLSEDLRAELAALENPS